MAPRRPEDRTADLFAAAAPKVAPPAERKAEHERRIAATATPTPLRHLLPMDLPGALARLDDGEIDALLAAVTDEAKRRGRLHSTTPPEPKQQIKRQLAGTRTKPVTSSQPVAGDAAPSLTLGKANAVRAAFAAGVKPSAIARQFGISQSTVKQALAGMGRGRKS